MVEVTELKGILSRRWAKDPRWSMGVEPDIYELVGETCSTAIRLGMIDLACGEVDVMPRLVRMAPLTWEIIRRLRGGPTIAIINVIDVSLSAREDLGPFPTKWAFGELTGDGDIIERDVDHVPPRLATYGRLWSARARDDFDMFLALILAFGEDDMEWMNMFAAACSSVCLDVLRRAHAEEKEETGDQG